MVCNKVTSCPLKVSLLLWRFIGLPNLLYKIYTCQLPHFSLLTPHSSLLTPHSSLLTLPATHFSGAVELEKLPLKKDALKKLKLPVDIKSGTAQFVVWLQAVSCGMKPVANLLCLQMS